jgi:hypothetical protein
MALLAASGDSSTPHYAPRSRARCRPPPTARRADILASGTRCAAGRLARVPRDPPGNAALLDSSLPLVVLDERRAAAGRVHACARPPRMTQHQLRVPPPLPSYSCPPAAGRSCSSMWPAGKAGFAGQLPALYFDLWTLEQQYIPRYLVVNVFPA